MCFWLHSDLKGYRDWAWSWRALAEGEWNLTSGEQSQDGPQASRPSSPAWAEAQDQLWEGHWRTRPQQGCQAGRRTGVSSFCSPTRASPQNILPLPGEQPLQPSRQLWALVFYGRYWGHWWGVSGSLIVSAGIYELDLIRVLRSSKGSAEERKRGAGIPI